MPFQSRCVRSLFTAAINFSLALALHQREFRWSFVFIFLELWQRIYCSNDNKMREKMTAYYIFIFVL